MRHTTLKRNDLRLIGYFALGFCLSMILSDLPSPAYNESVDSFAGLRAGGKPASTPHQVRSGLVRDHALDGMAQTVILQWQRAHALAGGGKDRVAQSRSERRYRRFADAAPKLAAWHDDGFDLWRVRKPQHFVSVEVRLLGGAILDGDFAVERCGQRVDDRALHLHFDRERVDHMAGINRRHHAAHPHFAVLDRDFDHLRAIAAAGFVERDDAEYA